MGPLLVFLLLAAPAVAGEPTTEASEAEAEVAAPVEAEPRPPVWTWSITGADRSLLAECMASFTDDDIPAEGALGSWYRDGERVGWLLEPVLPHDRINCVTGALKDADVDFVTLNVVRDAPDVLDELTVGRKTAVLFPQLRRCGELDAAFLLRIDGKGRPVGFAASQASGLAPGTRLVCAIDQLRGLRFGAGAAAREALVRVPLDEWTDPVPLHPDPSTHIVVSTQPKGKRGYPKAAERLEIQGRVRLRILFDETGHVASADAADCTSDDAHPDRDIVLSATGQTVSGWHRTACVQAVEGPPELFTEPLKAFAAMTVHPLEIPGGYARFWADVVLTFELP